MMSEVRCKVRIMVLIGTILCVFIWVGSRLVQLHLHPEKWIIQPLLEGRMLTWEPMGNRGRIMDRNGEILAMDLPAYHVCADPSYISKHGDIHLVTRYLSQEFGLSKREVYQDLSQTNRQYVRIKKYVPNYRLERFHRRSFGLDYTPKNGTTNIYLRGLMLEEAPIRNYPKGALMAHVVGFSNREGVGGAGIEQKMDEFLRGKKGRRVSRKDGRRREIYHTRSVDIEPQAGNNVILTLDQRLQDFVERAIEKMREEFHATASWAIVQNVRTGEILAMASSPTYDLNRYGAAPPEWRRNRPISITYEPGSTMKAGVIAAAMDLGIVSEDTLIDCENGYWVYGGKALRDSHAMGKIPVSDVIKHSSNIGTAKIALKMGEARLYQTLKNFSFGRRFGIELPGEEAGIFHSPRNWSKISITRIGMGHEIGVTALQVLSMMSAIAYNGVQMKPQIIKKIVKPNKQLVMEFPPEVVGKPLRPAAAQRMRKLLVHVTDDDGTAPLARVKGYTVAGKTGTAQKVRPREEGGGYYKKRFISSFVGFLPAENPQIAIIVVADDPGIYKNGRKTKYFGGTVCAPTFSEIAQFAVRYLRIPPDIHRVYITQPE